MVSNDQMPLNALLPASSREPAILELPALNLRFAIVERDFLKHLNATEWNVPGNYLLLYPANEDRSFDIYVGKSKGLRGRAMEHHNDPKKGNWERAILIAKDRGTFHVGEIAHLESTLFSHLDQVEFINAHNDQTPGDGALEWADRIKLDPILNPVERILRLVGYNLDRAYTPPPAPAPVTDHPTAEPPDASASPAPETEPARADNGSRSSYNVSLKELIRVGYLPVGTAVTSIKGDDGVITDGGIQCDGFTFSSPSAGSKQLASILDGWNFWLQPDGQPIDDARQRYLTDHPAAPANRVDLAFASITRATVNMEEVPKNWSALLKATIGAIVPQLGSADALINELQLNVVRGRHKGKGFHPMSGYDISIQNVEATRAWQEVSRLAAKFGVPVRVEYTREANPTETLALTAGPDDDGGES